MCVCELFRLGRAACVSTFRHSHDTQGLVLVLLRALLL